MVPNWILRAALRGSQIPSSFAAGSTFVKPTRLAVAVLIAAAVPCAWLAADEDAALVNPVEPAGAAGELIPAPPGVEGRVAGSKGWKYVGTASCTAANCHGGDGARPVRPGGDPVSPQAYSKWIQNDPHAGAFEVLYEPRSQRMAERLGLANAYTAQVCLDCHAVNPPPGELTATARHTPHDGVGCEACHGAAEGWLDAHKWGGWDSLSAKRKQELGYRDLTDLTERTRACADCHVGSPGRDVNHDLIAAGHPRMAFEMSAYHANLPKHWSTEATPADELDARLWLMGQAASAESALALLAHRAGDAEAPWPEFSEYDCFACHHDLAHPSWRQTDYSTIPGLTPGAAPWGSWNFAFLPLVRGQQDDDGDSPLDRLRIEMQRLVPDREKVRELTNQTLREADKATQLAASQPIGPEERSAWLERLTAVRPTVAVESWDFAAQRFLACAAMNYAAWTAAKSAGANLPTTATQIAAALELIRDRLQFGDAADAARYDSPKDHSARRGEVTAAFDEIHRAAAAGAQPKE